MVISAKFAIVSNKLLSYQTFKHGKTAIAPIEQINVTTFTNQRCIGIIIRIAVEYRISYLNIVSVDQQSGHEFRNPPISIHCQQELLEERLLRG